MADKKEYVKLWLSYATYFEAYSAAEVGRLVLAMMEYKSSGAEPEFSGSERFIWPAIKRDIDGANEAQEAAASAHREAGRNGGRPSARNQNNQNGFRETNLGQGNRQGQGQGSGQGQQLTLCDPSVAAVIQAFQDRINPVEPPQNLQMLANYTRQMGKDVCLKAIDIALSQKVAKWSYVRGILQKWSSKGVKCLADIERLDKKQVGGKSGGEPGGSSEKFEKSANERHGYTTADLD